MTENSHAFIETKVQFWIDLVQVRAPGSKVIIVATHADECGEEKEYILRILQEQLTENESLRLHDIKAELQQLQGQLETTIYGTSAYKQLKLKMALLKKSLNMRPQIVSFAPVIAETEIDGSIKNDYNIESLVAAIRHVSTATADEQNPFQLVNVFHPRFYGYVKQAAEVLRRSRTIITMEALHEASLIEARVSSSAPTIKETESAVAFLSCIGEVVWFRDRSMCSYDDDDYSDGESEGAPFYDEDSSYPGNSNDRDDSATWAWVESLDIGSYVVLNPHWLLNAVKGVLTHELSTDVHFLRQSMGSVEIDRRFGQSNDERNGIVRWPLIEALLSRNSEIASEPNERHNTLQVLRLLLEHFNIIVPIKLDISNPETASTLPSNGNRSQDIQESPLTSSTIGIASILTVSGCTAHDVLRSTSTSDLLSPTYSSPLCPRANSGGYLNALNSSGGERSRIPASPLTSAASTSELQTLHLRGVSDPTGSKASSGFMSCKRNRSVGDILSEASRTPVLDVPDEYFLVPGDAYITALRLPFI